MIKKSVLVVCTAVAIFSANNAMADCKASAQNQQWGGAIGNMLGDIVKNKFGKDLPISNSTINQFSRALGSSIACSLSENEQKQAFDTQTKALNSGKVGSDSTVTWNSEERVKVGGGTKIVSRNKNNGNNCAVTSTFITDENGKEQAVDKELCQQTDGSWA